jgi:hypothetical protein
LFEHVEPFGLVQTPSRPGELHFWPSEQLELSQHTPSTQDRPLGQVSPVPHVPPIATLNSSDAVVSVLGA